jgi:hypothetical protein
VFSGFPRRSFARRRFGLRRRRQRLEWIVIGGANSAAPGMQQSVLLVPNSFITTMTRPTIMRIRGTLLLETSSTSEGEVNFATLGIQLSPDATPLGSTELPAAQGDSNRWMWWHGSPLIGSTATDTTGTITAAERSMVDVRSKRVCSELDQLILVVENTGGGLGTISFAFFFRILFREVTG